MQDPIEIMRIKQFLCTVVPILTKQLKLAIQEAGFTVTEQGDGLDSVFLVKCGNKEIKFFLHNLLMEIATVDRDQEPLRFDKRLRDFDYFLAKTARLTESKLNILLHMLSKENVDATIESIIQDAKQYERIRIWRFDQEKPAQDHQP